MKRVLMMLLVVSMMAAILFAGGEQEDSSSSSGITTLRVWKFGGPQHEREYMLEKVAVFEEQNPDIKIDWIYQNYPERRTKVITASQAGTLPHVIVSDGQSIPEFATLGIIQAYEDFAPDKMREWKTSFVDEAWDTGVYNGKTYAISTYVDAATMIAYNSDMFKEAGIVDASGEARPPANWDEVVEIARMFKEKGLAGIALPGSNAPNDALIMQGIAYRNGGRWIEGDKVTVDGPGFVDTLSFYSELTKYAQQGFTETNFRQAMELFFQNQAPMAMTMSYAPILRQSLGAPADYPYSIAPFPKNNRDTGRFSSASFIMTPTAAHMIPTDLPAEFKDAALRYVDFWASYEAQEGWSGSVIEGRLPVMKQNLESSDFARVYPDLAASYKEGKLFDGALSMPGFPGLAEAEQRLIEVFQSVLLGIETPEEGLSRIAPEIQSIYDAAR